MITQSVLTSEEKENSKQLLINYLNKYCVKKSPPDNQLFGIAPGDRYSWHMYLGNALYNSKVLEVITYMFLQEVHEKIGHYNFQLAGREWSACPLLAGLPLATRMITDVDLSSFMIKRERKGYGMRQFTEGVPQKNLPVLIIDDAFNATDSFVHCRRVCTEELGLEILPFIFAPFNKQKTGDGKSKEYDHLLGRNYRGMWCVTLEEVQNAQPTNFS
jgi:orotate phosphoribosyltransferase